MTPKLGQRLEKIIYYCDERKKHFTRLVLVEDDLETRRKLCGVIFELKTAWNNHKNLLLKSIDGKRPRMVGSGSKSVAAYLYGERYAGARRTTDNLWDLTKESYSLHEAEDAVQST